MVVCMVATVISGCSDILLEMNQGSKKGICSTLAVVWVYDHHTVPHCFTCHFGAHQRAHAVQSEYVIRTNM